MSEIHPAVRYMILCDDVYTDPDNPHRVTLDGLITAIRLAENTIFPVLSKEFCVYVQLTECRGPAEGKIEIQHADTDETVFHTKTRTIPLGKDPLGVYGVTFRIRNCLFHDHGLYWVQFWYNDTMIAQQPLLVR